MNTTLTLAQIIEAWKMQLNVKPITVANYLERLNLFFRFLAADKRETRCVNTDDIQAYKTHLISLNKSSTSVNVSLTAIRSFYKYCNDKRYWPDVSVGIRNVKSQRYYHHLPLTEDQARRLLDSIDTSREIGLRDKLIVSLMLFCGLRTCEVARIDIKDFDTEGGKDILYIQRKGHICKDARVPVDPLVMAALEDYLIARNPDDTSEPLIISYHRALRGRLKRTAEKDIEGVVKRRLIAIGLNDRRLSTHSLRHTFGTLLLRSGASLSEIQELMGHTSLDTTEIYVKMEQEQRIIQNSPVSKMKQLLGL